MAHPFPNMSVDDPAEFLIAAAARDALFGRKIWRQIATYHEVVPPMHKGNPYIEALPPTPSRVDLMKMLEVRLPYSDEDRLASVENRAQMVMQLLNFVQPLTKTLEVFDAVNRAMRSSYITRNPASPRFLADARKAALELRENWSQNPVAWRQGVAAFAVVVFGATGVGKTTAVGAGLALFPSCIIHITYRGLPIGTPMQIPWIKLDCPQDGSLKALFIAFFIEVDAICAGKTNYAWIYGRNTTDVMIGDIAFLCRAHGIGVLALDQVNNLRLAASQQDEKLFQALLALVNGIGVSVFFIGTFAVEKVLKKQFQIARRCCALGSITIERLTYDQDCTLKELKDSDLGLLIRGMWKYCYVRDPCKLDKRIFSAFYNNSQGINGLIVGLYILAHLRCFRIKKEQITAEIIDQVAGDRLRLLRPLLDLLRSGQVEADVPGLDDLISPALEGAIEAEMSHGPQNQASAVPDELAESADSGADSRPLDAQGQASSIDAPVGEASSTSASTKERRPMKQPRRSLVTISRNAAKNKLSVHDALRRAGFIRDITTPALAS